VKGTAQYQRQAAAMIRDWQKRGFLLALTDYHFTLVTGELALALERAALDQAVADARATRKPPTKKAPAKTTAQGTAASPVKKPARRTT